MVGAFVGDCGGVGQRWFGAIEGFGRRGTGTGVVQHGHAVSAVGDDLLRG